MLEAGARLKKSGYSEVRLMVSPDNSAAVSLYKYLEYSTISTIADAYGIGEHRMIMQKKL